MEIAAYRPSHFSIRMRTILRTKEFSIHRKHYQKVRTLFWYKEKIHGTDAMQDIIEHHLNEIIRIARTGRSGGSRCSGRQPETGSIPQKAISIFSLNLKRCLLRIMPNSILASQRILKNYFPARSISLNPVR